jgi:SAM-dependent methyltransferase
MSRWYPRVAAVLLPLVVIALAFFVYRSTRGHEKGKRKPAATTTTTPTLGSGADTATTKAAFDDVYKRAVWGTNAEGQGTSGGGSTMKNTVIYRAFLQQFMEDKGVTSVVDAGCGDWEFSQSINWDGIDYKGYDIVDSVIEENKKKFAKPNIQFFAGNIVTDELPAADLLICKQVLQHLPSKDVATFLKKLPKYKHVLITNSVGQDFSAPNTDIAPGDYRTLDITVPPFDVKGAKILTWWDGSHMQQVVYISPR